MSPLSKKVTFNTMQMYKYVEHSCKSAFIIDVARVRSHLEDAPLDSSVQKENEFKAMMEKHGLIPPSDQVQDINDRPIDENGNRPKEDDNTTDEEVDDHEKKPKAVSSPTFPSSKDPNIIGACCSIMIMRFWLGGYAESSVNFAIDMIALNVCAIQTSDGGKTYRKAVEMNYRPNIPDEKADESSVIQLERHQDARHWALDEEEASTEAFYNRETARHMGDLFRGITAMIDATNSTAESKRLCTIAHKLFDLSNPTYTVVPWGNEKLEEESHRERLIANQSSDKTRAKTKLKAIQRSGCGTTGEGSSTSPGDTSGRKGKPEPIVVSLLETSEEESLDEEHYEAVVPGELDAEVDEKDGVYYKEDEEEDEDEEDDDDDSDVPVEDEDFIPQNTGPVRNTPKRELRSRAPGLPPCGSSEESTDSEDGSNSQPHGVFQHAYSLLCHGTRISHFL